MCKYGINFGNIKTIFAGRCGTGKATKIVCGKFPVFFFSFSFLNQTFVHKDFDDMERQHQEEIANLQNIITLLQKDTK